MSQTHSKILSTETVTVTQLFKLKQNGAALITAMLILGLLTTLSITGLRMSGLQEKMTGNEKLITIAEFAAERGISEAVSDLLDGTITDAMIDASPVSMTINGFNQPYLSTMIATAGYNTQYNVAYRMIPDPSTVASPSHIVASNTDGKPYYLIQSTGSSDKAGLKLESVISLDYASIFETGLVGCYGVTFPANSGTSSYKSTVPGYAGEKGDVAVINRVEPGNGIQDGDLVIGANSNIRGDVRATGALVLNSGSTIQKDVYANDSISCTSNSPDTFIGQDAYSIGGITACNILGTSHPNQTKPVVASEECDPIDLPQIMLGKLHDAAPALPGTATLSRTLPSGSAHNNSDLSTAFQGSTNYDGTIGLPGQARSYYLPGFTVGQNQTVAIDGDVLMYLTGDFRINSNATLTINNGASLVIYLEDDYFVIEQNSLLQNNNSPRMSIDFQLFSLGSNTTSEVSSQSPKVEINSNNDFFGTLYAPYANLVINADSDLYGAARGKWTTVERVGHYYYDEDLLNTGGGEPKGFDLIYWNQQTFTP